MFDATPTPSRQAERIMQADPIACSLDVICFMHAYIDRAMGTTELLGRLDIQNGLAFLGILLPNRTGPTWAVRFALINHAARYVLMYERGRCGDGAPQWG